jgi:5-methylcytosine-specific restriction endonuclease McrA
MQDAIKNGLSGRDYTRELVRIRDNRTCQMCGKKWKLGNRRFDVHHLNLDECGYRTLFYDKVENIPSLITYCHKCHLNLHSVTNKISKKQGLNKLSPKKVSYYKKVTR